MALTYSQGDTQFTAVTAGTAPNTPLARLATDSLEFNGGGKIAESGTALAVTGTLALGDNLTIAGSKYLRFGSVAIPTGTFMASGGGTAASDHLTYSYAGGNFMAFYTKSTGTSSMASGLRWQMRTGAAGGAAALTAVGEAYVAASGSVYGVHSTAQLGVAAAKLATGEKIAPFSGTVGSITGVSDTALGKFYGLNLESNFVTAITSTQGSAWIRLADVDATNKILRLFEATVSTGTGDTTVEKTDATKRATLLCTGGLRNTINAADAWIPTGTLVYTDAIITGAGASGIGSIPSATAGATFVDYRTASTATSGTSVGGRFHHKVQGATSGGIALRAFGYNDRAGATNTVLGLQSTAELHTTTSTINAGQTLSGARLTCALVSGITVGATGRFHSAEFETDFNSDPTGAELCSFIHFINLRGVGSGHRAKTFATFLNADTSEMYVTKSVADVPTKGLRVIVDGAVKYFMLCD